MNQPMKQMERFLSDRVENMMMELEKSTTGAIELRLLIIVLGLLAFILAAGCSKPEMPHSDETVTTEYPTSRARNTLTVFTTAGIKTTEIYSDSVINFAEKDSTQAYVLRVKFYDNNGEWMSLLTADSGVIREKTEHLEVYGLVKVSTRDSIHMHTTQLAWDPGKAKIISDKYVTIDQRGDIIRGYGLEADPDLKNIKLKREITGEIQDYDKAIDSL